MRLAGPERSKKVQFSSFLLAISSISAISANLSFNTCACPAHQSSSNPSSAARSRPGDAQRHHSMNFWRFVGGQLGWEAAEAPTAADVDEGLEERRAGIHNFVKVPWNLEKMVTLGYLMCLDAFLHQIAFMPLRVLGAMVSLSRRQRPSQAQTNGLLRAVVVAAVSFLLLQVDMSHAYHSVRGLPRLPRAWGECGRACITGGQRTVAHEHPLSRPARGVARRSATRPPSSSTLSSTSSRSSTSCAPRLARTYSIRSTPPPVADAAGEAASLWTL